MSSLPEVMYSFYRRQSSVESGATNTTSTAGTTSPSFVGLTTGSNPVSLEPNTAGTATMNVSILEGAEFTGGTVVNYTDLGNNTNGDLISIVNEPTVSNEGITLFNLGLSLLNNNVNSLFLKPNTSYLIKVTNTAITAESYTNSLIVRRL